MLVTSSTCSQKQIPHFDTPWQLVYVCHKENRKKMQHQRWGCGCIGLVWKVANWRSTGTNALISSLYVSKDPHIILISILMNTKNSNIKRFDQSTATRLISYEAITATSIKMTSSHGWTRLSCYFPTINEPQTILTTGSFMLLRPVRLSAPRTCFFKKWGPRTANGNR